MLEGISPLAQSLSAQKAHWLCTHWLCAFCAERDWTFWELHPFPSVALVGQDSSIAASGLSQGSLRETGERFLPHQYLLPESGWKQIMMFSAFASF